MPKHAQIKLPKKEFYFIRHGQTDFNIGKITDEYLDVPLNETGHTQAHSIEPIVSTLPIKAVCFSPLQRAKQTKTIITRALLVDHHEDYDLKECDLAIWNGMTALAKQAHLGSEKPVGPFLSQVHRGLTRALEKEGPVLIVAHGGVHYAIQCLLQVDDFRLLDNCGLIHFIPTESGWGHRELNYS